MDTGHEVKDSLISAFSLVVVNVTLGRPLSSLWASCISSFKWEKSFLLCSITDFVNIKLGEAL